MSQSSPNPFGDALWTGPNAQGIIDMDPMLRRVTGRDVLSQSLVRRQTTPRGTVVDSPNDCFDVRSWVSDGMTQAQLQQLSNVIRTELLRDQRVQDCQVQVSYNTGTSALTVVENIQSGYGPFSLTLAVTAVTVQILEANNPGAVSGTGG